MTINSEWFIFWIGGEYFWNKKKNLWEKMLNIIIITAFLFFKAKYCITQRPVVPDGVSILERQSKPTTPGFKWLYRAFVRHSVWFGLILTAFWTFSEQSDGKCKVHNIYPGKKRRKWKLFERECGQICQNRKKDVTFRNAPVSKHDLQQDF